MTADEGTDAPATPASPTAGPEPEPGRRRRRLPTVLAGMSWRTVSQVVFVAVNLGLTPFLLHHLGLTRYGLWALLNIYLGVLLNLDGGLGSSATRFFAVRVGADDRRGCSRLLATFWLLAVAFVVPIAIAVALLAPTIAAYLHGASGLRSTAVELIRLFMPVVLISALEGALASLIGAHHRWGFLSAVTTASQLLYAGLAVVLVLGGHGVVGLVYASLAQQTLALVCSVVGARGMFRWRELVPLPWAEIRALLAYSSRVQVSLMASLVNFQLDAVVVSAFLPLRDVALYAIGGNFYLQLRALPRNALPPIVVTLSRIFGRDGLPATVEEFTRLQRTWVRTIASYCAVGAIAGYVAIPHWLGPKEQVSGAVAAILLGGAAFALLSEVMMSFTNAANYPGLESRYGVMSMVVNVAFTVALAIPWGVYGVAVGTALGQLLGSLYFQRLVRRRVDASIRSFFLDVPIVAVVTAAAVTAALELGANRVAPQGVLGILTCAVPAGVGLAVYGLFVFGARPSARAIVGFVRPSGSPPAAS